MPFVAVFGADLGEQEHHLGHRLLPAGKHLGVADRVLQRKHDRGQLDRGDPVDGRGAGREGFEGGVGCGQRAGRLWLEMGEVSWVLLWVVSPTCGKRMGGGGGQGCCTVPSIRREIRSGLSVRSSGGSSSFGHVLVGDRSQEAFDRAAADRGGRRCRGGGERSAVDDGVPDLDPGGPAVEQHPPGEQFEPFEQWAGVGVVRRGGVNRGGELTFETVEDRCRVGRCWRRARSPRPGRTPRPGCRDRRGTPRRW